MIVLDTDVLSALMRPEPDVSVRTWLDDEVAESTWTTTISIFEIRLGLGTMPDGRRRSGLETAFLRTLSEDLQGRILVFDRRAAEEATALAARRRQEGRTVGIHDTQIAGIALAHRAALATRNTRHFEDLTVEVIDPWTA